MGFSNKDLLLLAAMAGLAIVTFPVMTVIGCEQRCEKKAAVLCKEARRRGRAKLRRFRSKPLLPTDDQQPMALRAVGEEAGGAISKTSFLHLPPEIRHQIYDWALGDPCVVQPQSDDGVNWGPRPPSWRAKRQRVRSDEEPPSDSLNRMVTYWGGRSGQPPRDYSLVSGLRCESKDAIRLICGDQPAWLVKTIAGYRMLVSQGPEAPRYLSLMRTCRVVYGELLERLYGQNTVSLYGQGMVGWISREWPLDGLARVRYVHVALVVDAAWARKRLRRSVDKAVRTLQGALPGMRQLDLEVAVVEDRKLATSGNAEWLWDCLCEILEKHLIPTTTTTETKGEGRKGRGQRHRHHRDHHRQPLEEFVLKVPVYYIKWDSAANAWDRGHRPLSSWSERDYRELKAAVCGGRETQTS